MKKFSRVLKSNQGLYSPPVARNLGREDQRRPVIEDSPLFFHGGFSNRGKALAPGCISAFSSATRVCRCRISPRFLYLPETCALWRQMRRGRLPTSDSSSRSISRLLGFNVGLVDRSKKKNFLSRYWISQLLKKK